MKELIRILVRRYENLAKHCRNKEKALEQKEDELSSHDYYFMGYNGGRADLYQDVAEELRIYLKESEDKQSLADVSEKEKLLADALMRNVHSCPMREDMHL